jgi:hypothetical protein
MAVKPGHYQYGMYGQIQTGGGWRIRNNGELEILGRGEDIVKCIKAQRIKWWGHLNRMAKTKHSQEDYGMEFHRNEIQRTSEKQLGR